MQTDLTGAWRLVSFQAVGTDGSVAYPLGVDASGQLLYDPSGRMSLHIVRADVEPFVDDDWEQAADEEIRDAWPAYLGYCGTFQVGADEVTHDIEGSWFPNLSGRPQRCRYRMENDDRLVLFLPGEPEEVRLTWERYGTR